MGEYADLAINRMMNPNYGRIHRQAYRKLKRENTMQAQGNVQAISSKQNVFQTQQGPAYNGSFKLDDGNWYVIQYINAGQQMPVQQGQFVSFQFDTKQNGNYTNNVVDKKSLNVQGGGQQQSNNQQQPQQQNNQGYQQGNNQGQQGNPGYQNRGGGQRSGGYNKTDPVKQAQIMRQSCLGYATQLMQNTLDVNSDAHAIAKQAQLALRIASELFFPFAENGTLHSSQTGQQPQGNSQQQQQYRDPQEQSQPHSDPQPQQQQNQGAGNSQGQQAAQGFDDFDDDIPF